MVATELDIATSVAEEKITAAEEKIATEKKAVEEAFMQRRRELNQWVQSFDTPIGVSLHIFAIVYGIVFVIIGACKYNSDSTWD